MNNNSDNASATTSTYIGRFAPSPTGPLHMGSLLSATASYLDAKANNGKWLLRIEDIDPPREIKGSSDAIITSLAAHHLHWDEEILWQHDQYDYYQDCLADLRAENLIYPCDCSRIQTQGNIYSGRCRNKTIATNKPYALRIKTEDEVIEHRDSIQGDYQKNIDCQFGDFILWRKDHLPAYQLAVIADDEYQNINHIIRGSDLLDSTPRQIYLARKLSFTPAKYGHLPVLNNHLGQKLSKQTHAQAINNDTVIANLITVLKHLGQTAFPETSNSAEELLTWAVKNWDISKIAKTLSLTEKG